MIWQLELLEVVKFYAPGAQFLPDAGKYFQDARKLNFFSNFFEKPIVVPERTVPIFRRNAIKKLPAAKWGRDVNAGTGYT
jgi:hypothetical protein